MQKEDHSSNSCNSGKRRKVQPEFLPFLPQNIDVQGFPPSSSSFFHPFFIASFHQFPSNIIQYSNYNLAEAGLEDMTEEELAFILGDLPSQVREAPQEAPAKKRSEESGYQFPRIEEEGEREEERYPGNRFEEERERNQVEARQPWFVEEKNEAECPLCQRFFPMDQLELHAGNCGIEEEEEEEEHPGFNLGFKAGNHGGFNEDFNGGGFDGGFDRGFDESFNGYEEERGEDDEEETLRDRRKGDQGYLGMAFLASPSFTSTLIIFLSLSFLCFFILLLISPFTTHHSPFTFHHSIFTFSPF